MKQFFKELSKIEFARKVVLHPFQGFWEIKKENEGSLPAALLLAILYSFSSIVKKYLSGFIFNSEETVPNLLVDLIQIVLPIFLWCVSNWCVTTLMAGEGRMRDIVSVTCYALAPMIVGNFLYTVLSNVLTKNESAFLLVIQIAFTVWSGMLIVFGILVAHQYTLSKTVIACLLTIIAMAILIFIILLIFSLTQEIIGLVESMIKELAYRSLG